MTTLEIVIVADPTTIVSLSPNRAVGAAVGAGVGVGVGTGVAVAASVGVNVGATVTWADPHADRIEAQIATVAIVLENFTSTHPILLEFV